MSDQPLTRDYRKTIVERLAIDTDFAEALSRELIPFNNRLTIEKSGSCACFGCLTFFPATEIRSWTDEGETAICPRCGIDSVLAQTELPITMKQLIRLNHEAFGISTGGNDA